MPSTQKTYYLPNGAKVTLDHIHEGMAFVYPMMVTQTIYGDDVEEHEHEADHLITLPASLLSKKPPVASLEEETQKLQDKIDMLRRKIKKEENILSTTRQEHTDLCNQTRKWKEKNPCFDRIIKLLNGEDMIALSIPSWKYWCIMPKILDTADAAALQLVNKGGGKFSWRGQWDHPYMHLNSKLDEHIVEFFDTEEDMQKFVTELWNKLLKYYAHTPKDGRFGRIGVTGKLIKYTTLVKWVEQFPFLTIPDSIEEDKAAYEAEQKANMLAAAKEKVAELEKS